MWHYVQSIIFKFNIQDISFGTCCDITLKWMPQNLPYEKSTLVMLWLGAIRHQAITWTSVDQCLCYQMQQLGHNVKVTKHITLQWCHNGHDSISNHQPHDCLLNRLLERRSKKTSKLRVTGLCVGNSPVTGEFPAQMASNMENVSIWWHHHEVIWKNTLIIFRLFRMIPNIRLIGQSKET